LERSGATLTRHRFAASLPIPRRERVEAMKTMPLTIAAPAPVAVFADLRERRARRGSIRDRGRRIRIGLVNNMPDAAMAATERQFARLIEDASGDLEIDLSLFSLETLPREAEARRAIDATHRAARELRTTSLDAIVVTGAEPRAGDLREEPYWRELAALIDWAGARTFSALFSCLAAHAAVLHLDGIERWRRPTKLSGVFEADVVAEHELVEGFANCVETPHSRYNGLIETDLVDAGYHVLTRSREAGVDMFIKQAAGPLVFLQGHPEYDADTLAREYRRDALRYLGGETAGKPGLPRHYFPAPLAARLDEWIARAAIDPTVSFPTDALRLGEPRWRAGGVRLFRNWLALVARRKSARFAPAFAARRWGG
jgi:homoserine O-succinyltransferase